VLNIKKICKSLKNPNGVLIGASMAEQTPASAQSQGNMQEALMGMSDIILEILWSYERYSID
jgi:hypothetical protein